MGFERQISLLRAEYRDHKSGRALARVNSCELARPGSPQTSGAKSMSIEAFLHSAEDGPSFANRRQAAVETGSSFARSAWASTLRLLLTAALVVLFVAVGTWGHGAEVNTC